VYRNCLDGPTAPTGCCVVIGWEITHDGRTLCSGIDTLCWSYDWHPNPDPYIGTSMTDSCKIRVTLRKPAFEPKGIYEGVVVAIMVDDDEDLIIMQPPSPSDMPAGWRLDPRSGKDRLVFHTDTDPVMDANGKSFLVGIVGTAKKDRKLKIEALSKERDLLAIDSTVANCTQPTPCDRMSVEKTPTRNCYKLRLDNRHVPGSVVNTVRLIVPDEGVMIHDVTPASGSWTTTWLAPNEVILRSATGIAAGSSVEFTVCLNVHPTVTSCNLLWQTAKDLFYICTGTATVDITLGAGYSASVSQFALYQSYPNPFNPTTAIVYTLAEREFVTIDVYDIGGKLVDRIVSEMLESGTYTTVYDASVRPSGTYIVTMRAGAFTATRRMTLMK
jgi:hypothetical protein